MTVGLAVLGWMTITLIEVDKKTAEIAVKVEANHTMITPMGEFYFRGSKWQYPGSNAPADQESSGERKWSTARKRKINCKKPRGFSERAHCASRKKRKR